MPAPNTTAEFLEVLKKSGLVPDDALAGELGRLRGKAGSPVTIDSLAVALVEAGLLSRFQAKQVKLGRYKRFEVAGKYRLLELLGVGGMGAVYLCEHMFMKRLVALKVLPVDKLQDPSALLRFYREARAVAALDHPNIVRAYDIDKFEQMHFLVMEYVDGVSIQEGVARHGPLDPYRAANYVAQAAHGLHHAHQLGMVHRDIKPGNLLLERTGFVKILDMGLARFFDQKNDNVTERFDNNCVLGTADYLAPEQAVSNVVDIRADIYALGPTGPSRPS
jgi:serine/threonine protein kinase